MLDLHVNSPVTPDFSDDRPNVPGCFYMTTADITEQQSPHTAAGEEINGEVAENNEAA